MTTRWTAVSLVCLLFPALAGCQSKADGAREKFSQENACPLDRVEVRERPDVTNAMTYPVSKPPPDVAADPGRLAMWTAEQEKNKENANTFGDMFEARGCGMQSLICCRRHAKRWNEASCTTRPYADGISRW